MKAVVNRPQADRLNPDVPERQRRQPAEQGSQLPGHFPGDVAMFAFGHFELRNKVRRNLRWLAAEGGVNPVLRAKLGHHLRMHHLA